MENKYFNDAIIGNKRIVVSYTKTGELLRMYSNSPDYRQFIEFMNIGLKINDSGLIKLHDDINNVYNQSYIENTNILVTNIKNTYFNLKIEQIDFVPIKENVLVKRYTFTNENTIDLDISLLIHSGLLTNENNHVSGKIFKNGLIQYSHDYSFGITSKSVINSHQMNDTKSNINTGIIQDKDYEGMSNDSSISFEIGIMKPKETKTIEIYIYINENKEKCKMDDIQSDLEKISKMDYEKELISTKRYWNKYLNEHSKLDIKENKCNKKVRKIYNRTILLYPLLTNETTGGIAAAIETDEKQTKCGRYAYCWPRDAVFITKALDILGMKKETEKFYKSFCKNTQSKNGMWEQRFYTDGRPAPCWGYQIDETASVVHGIYDHYLKTKDKKFLKDTLKMCEKAIHFLERYIEQIMDIKEEKDIVKKEIQEYYKNKREKISVSYDLWEMHEGIHLYSLAAIYSAYESMLGIYQNIELEKDATNNRLKQENILKKQEKIKTQQEIIKKYVIENMYDENKKSYVRGLQDDKIDISILGAVVPFNMFTSKEKKILNTVEKINLTLRTYTGGYKRFEQDHYMNGNPWPIATLWMALYYIEINEYKKAEECFKFVIASSTEHGYLAEQIENETMKPAWVIGLGWSHAMFIIVLEKLIQKGRF